MDINAETTRHVDREIKDSRIPLTAVAEKAGIPYSTLQRRLQGGGQWTATEIFGIAAAIRASPTALLPLAKKPAEVADMVDAA